MRPPQPAASKRAARAAGLLAILAAAAMLAIMLLPRCKPFGAILPASGCPTCPACPAAASTIELESAASSLADCLPLPGCLQQLDLQPEYSWDVQQEAQQHGREGAEQLRHRNERRREEPQQQQRQQQQKERAQSAAASPSQLLAAAEVGEASEASGESEAAGTDRGELVCGGPDGVLPPPAALAEATRDLWAALDAAFGPYAEGFTLEDVIGAADQLGIDGTHDTLLWVEVRNDTVVFPRRHGLACSWYCNGVVQPLLKGFQRGLSTGRLRVPEGLPMLWNVYDYSVCERPPPEGKARCPSPVFSVIKHFGHVDVAVPPFNPHFEPQFVPWSEKVDQAFFRGSLWCVNPHPLGGGTQLLPNSTCSRESVPLLAEERPDLLDVTVVDKYHPHTTHPVSHRYHARYKYLINLDGVTASRRLATLLSMNSAVLKQESPWVEWYYPGLRSCIHYLPFWQRSERDIVDLVSALHDSTTNQAMSQRVAANGQLFAAVHLNKDAVYRYWQAVLDRYVALYRGPTDLASATAVLELAEQVGRAASHAGEAHEAACIAADHQNCWMEGRDQARWVAQQLRQAAEAAAAAGQAAEGVRAAVSKVVAELGIEGADSGSGSGSAASSSAASGSEASGSSGTAAGGSEAVSGSSGSATVPGSTWPPWVGALHEAADPSLQ